MGRLAELARSSQRLTDGARAGRASIVLVGPAFRVSTLGEVALALLTAACGKLSSTAGSPVPDASTDASIQAVTDAAADGIADSVTSLDDGGDAAVDEGIDVAAPEAGAAATCDGGDYFIVVGTDAGSQVLGGGCAPLAAPSLSVAACAEDCKCNRFSGCSDAASLDLYVSDSPGPCSYVQEAGTYPIWTGSWTSGGATSQAWFGSIRFDPFPPYRGALTGDYSVTLSADGGPGDTLSGAFCIQY